MLHPNIELRCMPVATLSIDSKYEKCNGSAPPSQVLQNVAFVRVSSKASSYPDRISAQLFSRPLQNTIPGYHMRTAQCKLKVQTDDVMARWLGLVMDG